MIPRTTPSCQSNDEKEHKISLKNVDTSTPSTCSKTSNPTWQQHLQQVITDPKELLNLLEIDDHYLPDAIKASQLFPLKVPRSLLNRINKNTLNDPILRQVLPIAAECETVNGYSFDPVGEQSDQPTGMIQKYHGRMLLMVNGHCAINCRYCFRRHYPYDDNRLSRPQWESALEHIANDHSISEIIYSGGDPLASSDKQLQWLTTQIAAIPHIKRLRIHTRLPVVIPNRITKAALQWMSRSRLRTVVVLHINHVNELNDDTLKANLQSMRDAGITLLNQAVLLKGVNDTTEDLVNLSEGLFEAGIIPYYLHVLDKIAGGAHFDTPEDAAKRLHHEITGLLPGYLVPKLVREEAEQASKTPL